MKKKNIRLSVFIVVFFALSILFEFIPFDFLQNERRNTFLLKILSLSFGSVGIILVLLKGKSRLFGAPTKPLFILPALLVAISNFPFASAFAGKMQLDNAHLPDFLLFGGYCLLTGIFEEGIFRGEIFPLFIASFEKTNKGLRKAFVVSSCLFGGMHLFNIFSGDIPGTLLQVAYSVLTGGLFAFVLMKTKNVLCCAIVHGIYNFGGMLFSVELGLGRGVVIDTPTLLTIIVVGVCVAAFVLYSLNKYTDEERGELYQRLGFGLEE